MKPSLVTVDPEQARAWLSTSESKTLSRVVGDLKAHMDAGGWTPDKHRGTPVRVDGDGVLRDGNHRLRAVVEHGKPVPMWACVGEGCW